MNAENLLQSAALEKEARFALMQPCFTDYLAAARLDEDACRRLLESGLASRDRDGFWRPTRAGMLLFDHLETLTGEP